MDSLKPKSIAPQSDRLTDLSYWESVHRTHPLSERIVPKNSFRRPGLLARIATVLAGGHNLHENYADYQFWKLLSHYLPKDSTARLLEIGAAPGTMAVEFSKRFGYVPYGVEYTPNGAEQVRAAFSLAGISPANVFHDDAFLDTFQSAHADEYDIVTSLGLIEHFQDVGQVVRQHINLLAPGGFLVIRIPRFQGVNYLLAKTIDPGSLHIHNLKIMKVTCFRQIFQIPTMKALYCGYQGCMHFLLADEPGSGALNRVVLSAVRKLQTLATIALYRLFAHRTPFESTAFSPFLVYVGQKSISTKRGRISGLTSPLASG